MQVIELQELARPIVMYGPKLFFLVFQTRVHSLNGPIFLPNLGFGHDDVT